MIPRTVADPLHVKDVHQFVEHGHFQLTSLSRHAVRTLTLAVRTRVDKLSFFGPCPDSNQIQSPCQSSASALSKQAGNNEIKDLKYPRHLGKAAKNQLRMGFAAFRSDALLPDRCMGCVERCIHTRFNNVKFHGWTPLEV
jgi:hypothetical protein